MQQTRPATIRQQTLHILREGILSRRWAGVLPGVRTLAKELAVSIGTLQGALKRLEKEGVIGSRGSGRRRQVGTIETTITTTPKLRIGILTAEAVATNSAPAQAFFYGLINTMEQAGHLPFLASKTMDCLKHDPAAILALMRESRADAWVVSRASGDVLAALAEDSPAPFIASGGRVSAVKQIAAAGIDITDALRDCVRHLVALGHTRIVMVMPACHREPTPGVMPQVFLDELSAAGIRPGPYNLPAWECSRQGFDGLLKSLFSLTPPTALILEDARQLTATLGFFAHHKISAQNIALIVSETDSTLEWIAHRPGLITFDDAKLIQRIMDWVGSCARGAPEREKIILKASFTPGDTPALSKV